MTATREMKWASRHTLERLREELKLINGVNVQTSRETFETLLNMAESALNTREVFKTCLMPEEGAPN